MRLSISKRWETGSASTWPGKEAARRAKGAVGLRPSEYDFSGVADRELKSCVHYEYARESARIAGIVEGMRAQWCKEVPEGQDAKEKEVTLAITKFTRARSAQHDGWFLLALGGRPDFPRVAWQDLTVKDRELLSDFPGNAIKMHNQEYLRKYPVFIGKALQEAGDLQDVTLGDWTARTTPQAYRDGPEEKRRKHLRSGFFMLNLGYSSDEIVKRFRMWLLKQHPELNKPAAEKRGRKSHRDRLNALGALRLRFYCRTLSEAQKVAAPLQKKEHGLYYSDRTAWNRACKRAVEYFREVLNLRETDLPIHHTEGWQK